MRRSGFMTLWLAIIGSLLVSEFTTADLSAQTCAPNCWVISGRVIGPDGEGVGGVDLDLIDPNGVSILLSGDVTLADGTFSFEVQETILANFYDIALNPPTDGSYFPALEIDHVLSGSTTLPDMTVDRGARLSGRVVDELGIGLPQVDLNFFDPTTGVEVLFSGDVTDGAGNFSVLTTLGFYDIEFRTTLTTPGGPYVPVEFSNRPLLQDVDLGDVVFRDGHIMTGTVTDAALTPVSAADLDVRDPITGDALLTPGDNTDLTGTFSFLVPSGDWVIEVDPPTGSILVARFIPVTITAGVTNDLGNIVLPDGVNVSGTTVDPSLTAVPEVDLDFVISATQVEIPTAHDNANSLGQFSVQVEPDVYDIQFRPPFTTGLAPLVLAAESVTVDTILGDVILQPGPALTGTVTANGAPLEGAEVTLEQPGTGVKVYTFGNDTSPLGTYALRQLPGIYDVVFTPPVGSGLTAQTIFDVDLSVDLVLDADLTAGPTPPPPVTALTCTATGTTIDLAWTNGALDYDLIEVRRDTVAIATLPGTATSFADSGLPAATYAYTVTPVRTALSGTATGCSATVTPPPPGQFLRGDANESGELNVADVITMLDYLFGTGTSAPCLDAFDVNDSGVVNIADPIGLLGYLFAAEAPPAPPFPTVGTDPTADSLAPCP